MDTIVGSMSNNLTIRDVVMIPGQGVGATVLQVGLVLSDQHIAWGDCIDVQGFSAEYLQKTITDHISPILIGKPASKFRDNGAGLDALIETITITETIQPPAPEGVSRRNLLRAAFEEPLPPAVTRKYEVTRPLAASVRYGISQALLEAAAYASGCSAVEMITSQYDFSLPTEMVPLYTELRPTQLKSLGRIYAYRPGAISVVYPGVDPVKEVGERAEFSQRYTRMMKEAALAEGAPNEFKPRILHSMKGAYSTIIGESTGKTLGRLSGLDTNARPYEVIVIDPMAWPERDKQIDKMKRLVDLMRLRVNMSLKVAIHADIKTVQDVRDFVEAKAAHFVVLDPLQMGSLHAVIDGAQICRDAEIGVLIGGVSAETTRASRLTTHVALALQPDYILAKPASQVGIVTVNNEMNRILFELGHPKE